MHCPSTSTNLRLPIQVALTRNLLPFHHLIIYNLVNSYSVRKRLLDLVLSAVDEEVGVDEVVLITVVQEPFRWSVVEFQDRTA